MKHISMGLVFLLLLKITPFSVAIAEEKGKVIIISEEVGEVIDAEERERFGLWSGIEGFKSAIFLQLPDGSYVAEVTYEEDGEEIKVRTPQSEMSIKSLKDYIEKFEDNKPELFDLKPKHQEAEKAAVYLEKAIVEKPPISSAKITAEISGGICLGALLGIGGGLIGYLFTASENSQDFESLKGLLGAMLGFAIAYPIGSVIGVYAIGNTGNETGSFAATLGGGVLGVGVGYWTIAMGHGYAALLWPPIGATIGFNVTRRYRNPPPLETGLINYRDSRLSLAVPSIYYTQKNTFEGKTITQNVTLIRINF